MTGANLYYEGQKLTQIIDKAVQETEILAKYGLDCLIGKFFTYVAKTLPHLST